MAETDDDPPWSDAVTAMYEANDHTFAMPANPAGDEFEQAWQDEVNKVLTGDKEPADALADAQDAAQKALDEAWATWDEK
jgi:multiple sugar transport system substrate-binding protein